MRARSTHRADSERARESCSKSSERDDINARYGLGLAYLAEGRADDAVHELERVGPSLGLSEDVRRPLGRAELARGRASRGVSLLVQVLRDDPAWDPEVRRRNAMTSASGRRRA